MAWPPALVSRVPETRSLPSGGSALAFALAQAFHIGAIDQMLGLKVERAVRE